MEVEESAGFVVNRILIPMINRAVESTRKALPALRALTQRKLGANHPMGPLELGDLIGLDVCLAIMEVLLKEIGDSKYRSSSFTAQDGSRVVSSDAKLERVFIPTRNKNGANST